LPVTTAYAGIPAVWGNETEGQKVIAAAKEHKEGENNNESIIINIHTDGVNVIEENGAVCICMEGNRELWDGENGHMKAIAGITVVHLGSIVWKDDASGYNTPTGEISTEYTYVGTERDDGSNMAESG